MIDNFKLDEQFSELKNKHFLNDNIFNDNIIIYELSKSSDKFDNIFKTIVTPHFGSIDILTTLRSNTRDSIKLAFSKEQLLAVGYYDYYMDDECSWIDLDGNTWGGIPIRIKLGDGRIATREYYEYIDIRRGNTVNGKFEQWWNLDRLKCVEFYDNDKPTGIFEEFYKNGQIKSRIDMYDGYMRGRFTQEWYESGSPSFFGGYNKEGRPTGKHYWVSNNKKINKIVNYDACNPGDVRSTSYYENESIRKRETILKNSDVYLVEEFDNNRQLCNKYIVDHRKNIYIMNPIEKYRYYIVNFLQSTFEKIKTLIQDNLKK